MEIHGNFTEMEIHLEYDTIQYFRNEFKMGVQSIYLHSMETNFVKPACNSTNAMYSIVICHIIIPANFEEQNFLHFQRPLLSNALSQSVKVPLTSYYTLCSREYWMEYALEKSRSYLGATCQTIGGRTRGEAVWNVGAGG